MTKTPAVFAGDTLRVVNAARALGVLGVFIFALLIVAAALDWAILRQFNKATTPTSRPNRPTSKSDTERT